MSHSRAGLAGVHVLSAVHPSLPLVLVVVVTPAASSALWSTRGGARLRRAFIARA